MDGLLGKSSRQKKVSKGETSFQKTHSLSQRKTYKTNSRLHLRKKFTTKRRQNQKVNTVEKELGKETYWTLTWKYTQLFIAFYLKTHIIISYHRLLTNIMQVHHFFIECHHIAVETTTNKNWGRWIQIKINIFSSVFSFILNGNQVIVNKLNFWSRG